MTHSRLLARNALLNFGAQLAPLTVAVVAIPKLIELLGNARFGILTLVWAAIGYFGLFDFGLGRALTHSIATRTGTGDTADLGTVTWTGLATMALFGVVGALLLASVTPLLVDRVLNVPPALRAEARHCFYLMAAVVPATLLASGFRGVLEAFQDFGVVSALRVPFGILNYLGPLAVLPFSHALLPVVVALCITRLMACAAHAWFCIHRYEFLRREPALDRQLVAPLLRYGGWLTVTNVISPLMSNLDRFMIGAILPVAAVTFYVTPYEIISKLYIIPGAVLGVLFPAFAEAFAANAENGDRTAVLMDRGMRAILTAIFPVTVLLVCFGRELLTYWISADFARQSAPVLQWLSVGVLVNCAGQVAFTAIQGVGRPDLTAKIHLAELPAYLGMMWIFGHRFGLVGVAMAWTARVMVDTGILFLLLARDIAATRRSLVVTSATLVAFVAVLAIGTRLPFLGWRVAYVCCVAAAFTILAWTALLDREQRTAIRAWIETRRLEPS
jgi:O-antigen/teichoic acid export membrane protein